MFEFLIGAIAVFGALHLIRVRTSRDMQSVVSILTETVSNSIITTPWYPENLENGWRGDINSPYPDMQQEFQEHVKENNAYRVAGMQWENPPEYRHEEWMDK